MDGKSIEDRINRGWFWGSESFKESLLNLYEKGMKASGRKGNRVYQSGSLLKDYAENSARAILKTAREHFGLSAADLKKPVRGDCTRAAIATRLHKETTMSQSWIAEQLGMKSAANVSRQIQVFRSKQKRSLPKKIREWMKI